MVTNTTAATATATMTVGGGSVNEAPEGNSRINVRLHGREIYLKITEGQLHHEQTGSEI